MALMAMPALALAAEPATQAAAPQVGSALPGGMGGQLLQLLLGLLLVVGLIFALAWVVRRVQSMAPGNAQVIEMIGSRAIGPRDRLVLVQVGKEQILLGITPGRITPLHVLKDNVEVPVREPATPEFAQRLLELMGKDKEPK
ncbi:flagellar biosynthetic protein FliO [Pseudomonas sp. DTU_2021_1001937_2_SI_NGA_ILE_001]|uniref:flagellar biosynthetic protein FliO n=2 Tax=Pseudomonas TaxID=286 RepID=UPI0028FC0BE5|nr:flagellar biosynthetic protein FliO [Pseudomonas sp. DTU_2021_1001937_2_SI_NGA_ILE_001]WNW14243.1 flagellar biosynthetic protein FliO [Pseudomonas sp. DTU_2021_1001937_2_SI_NGA_ILE_001]